MKKLIVILWTFFLPLSVLALQPVLLTDSAEKYTLRIIEILEDQTKSLSFQDVLNKSSSFYVPGKESRTQYGEYIYKYKNDGTEQERVKKRLLRSHHSFYTGCAGIR